MTKMTYKPEHLVEKPKRTIKTIKRATAYKFLAWALTFALAAGVMPTKFLDVFADASVVTNVSQMAVGTWTSTPRTVTLGSYNEHDLVWRVLEVKADGKALLLLDDVLRRTDGNVIYMTVRNDKGSGYWYKSEVNSFLNNTNFFNSTNFSFDGIDFTGSVIANSDADDSKVFLLSGAEAGNADYFADDDDRIAAEDSFDWWLRDYASSLVGCVSNGSITSRTVDSPNEIRPAIWIDTKADIFKTEFQSMIDVTITSTSSDFTLGAFDITITFDEDVFGFDDTDITITNGSISNFSGSGSVYTATVTPTGSYGDTITVSIPTSVAAGSTSGNKNKASAPFKVLYSNTGEFVDSSTGLKYKVLTVNGDVGTVELVENNYNNSSYIIPETVTKNGVIYTVTGIANQAFSYKITLTSISLPNSITSIGDNAFCNTNLVLNALPENIAFIGIYAFDRCPLNISTLPVGYNVINTDAFACTRLNDEFIIPNGVTTIGKGSFFDLKNSAINIYIPSSVTEIKQSAFRRTDNNCHYTLYVPNQTVKDMLTENYNYTTGFATIILKSDVSSAITFEDESKSCSGSGDLECSAAGIDTTEFTPSGTGTWTYTYSAVAEGTGSLDSDGLPLTAGDYTVTASFEDNKNIGSKTIAFSLTAKQLTADMITINGGPFTYSGSAQTPSITVTDGTTLVLNTDYENVTYSNNSTTGLATVSITGKGIYSGTVSKTFEIGKASISIDTITPPTKNWDGTSSATAGAVTFSGLMGSDTLVLNTDYSVSAVYTGSNFDAGTAKAYTYTITMLDTANTNNYTLDVNTKSGNDGVINQITYTGTASASGNVKAETVTTGNTITLPVLPAGASYVCGPFNNAAISNVSVSGNILTFDVDDTMFDADSATAVLFVNDAVNYLPYTINLTVTAQAVLQENTPIADVDFVSSKLTGLVSNAAYTVNGTTKTANASGEIVIDAAWYGNTISIVKLGVAADETVDSNPQSLAINSRPIAPTISKTDTTNGDNNGIITDVDTTMEYRLNTQSTWTSITSSQLTGLAAGTYEVRVKATMTAFAGVPASVEIAASSSNNSGGNENNGGGTSGGNENNGSNNNNYTPSTYYPPSNPVAPTHTTTNTVITTGSLSSGSGVTTVINRIKSAKNGSTITVKVNNPTICPEILKTLKGRNVNLVIVTSNGATIKINSTKITNINADINLNVKYNTKKIPTSLVNKAKKLGTTAQFSFGDDKSFGFACDLTVKFNSKNAGKTAKLYRYDSKNNKLVLVAKATIGTDGKTTFEDITHGGEFIAVIK